METQLSEVFDAEIKIPPISSISALAYVLKEVQLYSNDSKREEAISRLREVGLANNDLGTGKIMIGVKKLLSIIETARLLQKPEAMTNHLLSALLDSAM